jgi:spore coat polysaccharide biosynthesis protein SpsF
VGAPICPPGYARPDLVLDVNTPDEYKYISALYDYLYPRNPRFGIGDIIEWHDRIWNSAPRPL